MKGQEGRIYPFGAFAVSYLIAMWPAAADICEPNVRLSDRLESASIATFTEM